MTKRLTTWLWILWIGGAIILLISVFLSLFLLPSNRSNPQLEYILAFIFLGLISNLIFRDVWVLYVSTISFALMSIALLPTLFGTLLTLTLCSLWGAEIFIIDRLRSKHE
jgi:hypothetical protein